ncbi:MAG: EcsC family protein [Desulfobacterales bacterium]|nr:EcsC family protein [Desulfobacterales bacterium]
MGISADDRDDLKYAKTLLENPSLAARISNLLGTPIEKGFGYLPAKWKDRVQTATEKSLKKALSFAVQTMDAKKKPVSSDKTHKLMVMATGAGGGSFGLPALAVELPVTTTIMLRSIADIARSEGEPISELETKLACLEVFALGGSPKSKDGTETGYYFVRAALARTITEAAQYIAEKGLAKEGAPVLVRLIAVLASRFGVLVSEKVAAQAIPVIGAAGGALINTIFIDHFQNTARGHFIVRRLERQYGQETVRQEYDQLQV